MPYIKQEDRAKFDMYLDGLFDLIENEGELNYVMTMLIRELIEEWGGNYAAMNKAIGAVECMKLELYRRVLADYEDVKIAENGDVHK